MTICVFTGPTLPPEEAARILHAEYMPPAAIGDVYRAALKCPWAIGIIDGIFENTPSVWHKEVLWAMAQGIHVFGASSMGALRAAELSAYGMVGVGKIFEAYRDGEIEDDDDVAVVHGPRELGYVQASEAMVNIRATLRKAASAGVISAPAAAALTDVAKSLYYKQRSYDRLLAEAAKLQLPADAVARLRAWLPANQVNQKHLDAIAMLEEINRVRATDPAPKEVSYRFEQTTFWIAVERQFGSSGSPGRDRQPTTEHDDLLEELRLNPALFQRIRSAFLLRTLMRRETGQQGVEPTVNQLQGATRRFLADRGLQTPAELDAWLVKQELSRDEFLQLMADETRRDFLERSLGATIDQAMLDELRASGDYAGLRMRAQHKRDTLQNRGVTAPDLSDSGLSEQQLVEWITSTLAPDILAGNIEGLAERLGYADVRDLLRAALREYCYRMWAIS